MATIGSRTFNLIEDRHLTLAGEEYLRPLGIGSNWTKLRLGLLVALTPNGTSNLPDCSLMLGVCSAATPFSGTQGYGAAVTGNYLGADFTNRTGSDLTYGAGSGNPYYYTVNKAARRRYGVTETTASLGGSYSLCCATNTGTLQRRTPLYVDITKGSPNYTLRPFFCSSAHAVLDFTAAHLLDGLEQSGVPVINGQTLQAESVTNIACDETAGVFDTLSLFWNRAAYPLEVYALAVFRAS
jgi:hypothetical protein